jgi:hypothetical protein
MCKESPNAVTLRIILRNKMTHIFIFCLFLLTTPLFGGVVNEGLNQLSQGEKLLIKEFIKINLEWNQWAHVIFFDNKPSSLAAAFLKIPGGSPHIQSSLWVEGFEIFKKYEHLFPHPNFIFHSEVSEEFEEGYQCIELYIINKRALAKCFDQHLPLFQEVLGKQCTFDWFILEWKNNRKFFDLIERNQILMGILLGYGKESSIAFKEHNEERLGWYFLRTDVYGEASPELIKGCPFYPVAFMGHPESVEAKNLGALYNEELNLFWKNCQHKDILRVFLEGICEEKNTNLEKTFKTSYISAVEHSFYIVLNPFSVNPGYEIFSGNENQL